MKECAHPPCVLEPTKDQWCWYHAKVASGLCDPAIPSSYSRKVVELATRTEMGRLSLDLTG